MDFASLAEFFKSRHSVRRWTDEPVSTDMVMQAIEAAGNSPNSGGTQPYRCYVITTPSVITDIGLAVQEVTDYLVSLGMDSMDSHTIERWQKSSSFFAKAPLLIAVSATKYQSIADKIQAAHPDEPRVQEINRARNIAASRIQTVGAFVDHLLLGLHAMGFGAVWMSGPAQAKGKIEDILAMSAEEDFVALIPVGYAKAEPTVSKRKPPSEWVFRR